MTTVYTHTLVISIPPSLYPAACAIARSLDPDQGGAASFGPPLQGDPPAVPATYSTSAPCSAAFAAQALAMAANPALLHAAVAADYATRWPDLTPPTLADCTVFCANASVTAFLRDLS